TVTVSWAEAIPVPAAGNAAVSPTEANCPEGFLYSLVAPVAVSVTLSVYSTLERAPKKTQNWLLNARASRTLTTSPIVLSWRHHRKPVAGVRGTRWPCPVLPWKSFHWTSTANRCAERQRVVAEAGQGTAFSSDDIRRVPTRRARVPIFLGCMG